MGRAKKGEGLKKYIIQIKLPIMLIIVNFLVANFVYRLLPGQFGEHLFTIGRIGIIIFAGWLVIEKAVDGLRKAAFTGPTLMFIDHVILKGGFILAVHFYKPELFSKSGLLAFGGVLVSYVMFAPVTILFGLVGGLLAKIKKKYRS